MTDQPLPSLDLSALAAPIDVSDNSAALCAVDEVVAQGPFCAEWASLRDYQAPLWYTDARFGIFIHWGIYSVPAFGDEWYSRNMYLEARDEFDHHVSTYGPHTEFGYKDFIPSFTMEKFDPAEWSKLFREAGAQFVVPVAEHHDGFALYDTDRSRWSAVQLGPKRDILGDLLQSVDDAWMVRGASSHRAEHWFFMNGGARFDSDVLDPELQDFYGPAQREETAPNERFLEDWLLRTTEIIDKYRPQILYFDWWIETPAFEPYLRTLAAYYYNRAAEWGREVVIANKWHAFPEGTAIHDVERGTIAGVSPAVWQGDTSVSKSSWCYTDGHDYKTASDLVSEIADVVSKNGVMLLNVGPRADGTIPAEEQALLRAVGGWLTRNGQAIYGSRPWTIPAEGGTRMTPGSFTDSATPAYDATDIRFTTRTDVTGEYVYAILLAAPTDGVARIRSFGTSVGLLDRQIHEVSVLGSTEQSNWTLTPEALEVSVPGWVDQTSGPVVKVFLKPEAEEPRHDFLHG